MKRILGFIAISIVILCLSNNVFAVVINQVLYDPVGTESGGEAVELYNPSDEDVSIGGWIIATESSETDAVLPANATISAKGYYLIADAGWSEKKDNPSWRNADFETTITMANSDSGIALRNSKGETVDAVGWGNPAEIKDGLYEGSPAIPVSAGMALLRIKDSDDNREDFIESMPLFLPDNAIAIIANLTESTRNAITIVDDDSASSGVQIAPKAGTKRIVKFVTTGSGDVFFLGKKIQTTNNSGTIELDYWLAPGTYMLTLRNGEEETNASFEYLALKAVRVRAERIIFNTKQGSVSTASKKAVIQNIGNTEFNFWFSGADLYSGNRTIPVSKLKYKASDEFKPLSSRTAIPVKSEKEVLFRLDVPDDVPEGNYATILKVEVD